MTSGTLLSLKGWRRRRYWSDAQWLYVPTLRYTIMIDGNPFDRPGSPVKSDYDILASLKAASPFTFNAVLGAWYRPVPWLEVALSGHVVPAKVVAKGTLDAEGVGVSAKGVRLHPNDVTVTLPLPLLARAGARYRYLSAGQERFDVEVDVEYVTWSRVQQLTIKTGAMKATAASLSADIPDIYIQKHWRDTMSVKLGGDYAVLLRRLTVRAGASHETAISPPAYTSVDFFGGARLGGSVGASVHLGRLQLTLAYAFSREQRVSVSEAEGRVYQPVPASPCQPPYTDTASCSSHYLGQPGPVVNSGTYRAYFHVGTLDVLYRF